MPLYATRVFDTPGLPSLDSSAAYGVKWAAAGFWKEGCSITYLQRPHNAEAEPHASPNTKRCMHTDPSPSNQAHSVLLLLPFTTDPAKIDEYAAFLKSLREGETVTWGTVSDPDYSWRTVPKRHYLEGIEPVIALTHAPCLSGGKAPCDVDSAAAELFARRLAHAADGDNAFLLAPEGPAQCRRHGHGHLCSARDLNFLPPHQYAPILHALKAKAIARIRAMSDGR
jgi:hypothetical protein